VIHDRTGEPLDPDDEPPIAGPRTTAEANRHRLAARAADRQRAINACTLCGDDGYRDAAVCHHDPRTVDAARRGIALVYATMGWAARKDGTP